MGQVLTSCRFAASQGVGNTLKNEVRHFSDRVEDYDVYNDLGRLPLNPKPGDVIDLRPVLGNMVEVQDAVRLHRPGSLKDGIPAKPFPRAVLLHTRTPRRLRKKHSLHDSSVRLCS